MEESILTSTKNKLGLAAEYTAFDVDIIDAINGVLATLPQLGIGPPEGYMIDSATQEWSDFITTGVPDIHLNSIRTLVFLKVRLVFDSSTMTSYAIQAMERQIAEIEWRLNLAREEALYPLEEV
jgi:hypothetical protein